MSALEQRIQAIGEDLFTRMKGEKPGLFNKAWWSGQVLEWAMRDEAFKTEMFRFVDVFPVLNSPEEIARHVREYLLKPGLKAPTVIKLALKGANLGGLATRMAAGQIAKNLEGMAKRFIAGQDSKSAMKALKSLRKSRQAFTVDLLGEATVSEVEAETYVARYAELINGLADECAAWKADPLLDEDDRGAIPRVNVSVKVSAMYSQLDPLAFDDSVEAAARRLIPLFELARDRGVFLNVDMEQFDYKDLTYAIFRRVLEDPRLADYQDAGVVVQAYLRSAEADTRMLVEWAQRTGKRVTVRLVKGAYWDYETLKAHQEGWESPVWLHKADTDACFERCAELLLEHHQHIRTAIGSHNVRSLAHAMACAERFGVPIEGYEIQALYGMAEPIKAACVSRGHRVRVYAPVGELIPGMAYLVRRLLENTSNQSWLRMGFVDGADQSELLAPPDPVGGSALLREIPGEETSVEDPAPFVNEPLRDFTEEGPRDAFKRELSELSLPLEVKPVIDGETVDTGRTLDRHDPADGRNLVARVTLAGIAEADQALVSAQAAWPAWRDAEASTRAAALFRMAAIMRQRRDALSALMVREVGKPWREADADTCEAIDFLEYYGREALRLAVPQRMQNLPGETNLLSYEGRGVALVIAPWNFPLAIFTGMVSAALVTGNAVLAKPAEQSSAIAAELAHIVAEAKLPSGVFQFLPGLGEEIGAHLVAHPEVSTIAFTGSMEVGLKIWQTAGMTLPGQPRVKRVVCEMGGKNAVIVDSDADLDEAVQGVVRSAFGFAGQKCSACSRVIVLESQHDAFVERLVEATRSLQVGAPIDPGTAVGPVADEEAWRRLAGVIQVADQSATRLVGGVGQRGGWFIEPTIFTEVDPQSPLAQVEHFGPVLAVLKAADFEEALKLANGTRFALTGGLFSRSPARIEQARRGFKVGNLYINRTITGAIVGRQPFGGFKMSGAGTKAGGPDYLLNFVDPRHVTENTQRRGFVPIEEDT